MRTALLQTLAILFLSACSQSSGDPADKSLPTAAGPAISAHLVGNNVWLNPSDAVWAVSSQAGLKCVSGGSRTTRIFRPPAS